MCSSRLGSQIGSRGGVGVESPTRPVLWRAGFSSPAVRFGAFRRPGRRCAPVGVGGRPQRHLRSLVSARRLSVPLSSTGRWRRQRLACQSSAGRRDDAGTVRRPRPAKSCRAQADARTYSASGDDPSPPTGAQRRPGRRNAPNLTAGELKPAHQSTGQVGVSTPTPPLPGIGQTTSSQQQPTTTKNTGRK